MLGDEVDDGLDEAEAEGLLVDGERDVRFTHPLLGRAAAAALTARERRRMHRELAGLVTDPDERAVHLAAGRGHPGRGRRRRARPGGRPRVRPRCSRTPRPGWPHGPRR